jgi:glycosyltransferase involved in cell wall biosynthesis
MKIGYFCYHLSGTGPRTRAADVIEAVAKQSEHEVVVLTNEPKKVGGPATVHPISLDNPFSTLLTTQRAFADADVVHVPVNMYQVLFVRLVYWDPLVGGIGPGLQPSAFHRYLGRLLRIDKKIKVLEHNKLWDNTGYETVVCTATINTDRFYQYSTDRIHELRQEWGFSEHQTIVLYVGALIEEQGAGIVDEMARLARDENIEIIVAGDGEMAKVFQDRDDLRFEGFVDNKKLPTYYNIADITVAPRRNDKTSNVGLESIACGTPMITTAQGHIVDLFKNRGTYVWADRTPEAVLETVRELMSDPQYYQAQVERGLETIEEMPLSLDNAVRTHLDVYKKLAIGRK